VRIFYTRNGKAVAQVDDATHVPVKGDYVFLRLAGSDQELKQTLFKVAMVAWNNELKKGDSDVPTFAQGDDVYVLIEPTDEP
jgi:hypothetical protein